jgi:hypothetical protein
MNNFFSITFDFLQYAFLYLSLPPQYRAYKSMLFNFGDYLCPFTDQKQRTDPPCAVKLPMAHKNNCWERKNVIK